MSRYIKKWIVLGLGLFTMAIAGCEGSGGVDPEIEPLLSLQQGVYGQTTTYDDVGEDQAVRTLSMELMVLPEANDILIQVKSDEAHGFYQQELHPGVYRICTTFNRCKEFVVTPGARIRLDYEMGPGPGWTR